MYAFPFGCSRWAHVVSSRDHLRSEAYTKLFEYTSGRWMYNEERRLKERRRLFNVLELQNLAAAAVSRKPNDIISIVKLGEGAANRAFVLTFRDGFRLVARIPYPVTEPTRLLVASEAATMTFLHSKGLPVPEVYDYSATADNSAGTEYVFMEYSPGKPLDTLWESMDERDRRSFTESLVDLETRLFNMHMPASGSLYFAQDLPATDKRYPVESADLGQPKSFFIGPDTSLPLWYGRRKGLQISRGPYSGVEAVYKAGAEKELQYLQEHGRPLHPFNRMQRETFNLEKQLPSVHRDSLQKYLEICKHLIPKDNDALLRPVLRHPDLRPSNIFVSSDMKITSLIDWQYSSILPLFLQSSIPNDIDNSCDPVSTAMEPPHLPENFSNLSEEEQAEQEELLRKRQLHHFYMRATAKQNHVHYTALTYPFSVARRKLYDLSSAPWEGDNIPLRSSLIFVKQYWDQLVGRPGLPCPITFTDEEERECLRLDDEEREAAEQLAGSREMLGLGPEGWVSHANYVAVKETIARMKEMCLDQAETEMERTAVREHWVFDDMDEDEYL